MPIEQTEIHPDWARLSGTILDGGYEVKELIDADGERAKFGLRVLGDRGISAFLNVFRAEQRAAEEQTTIWQIARQLQHPNLSAPLTSGLLPVDGSLLVYIALRKPNETLNEVLRDRPLNQAEAGEVLLSISSALEYLHAQGLVQGCISPEEILAVGDSVELSTECVRRAGAGPTFEVKRAKYRAPESNDGNVTPEADVWCLGATLFEALTQKDCAAGCREQSTQLPGRFRAIVERCLEPDPQTRCKLPEVLALYRGTQSAAPPQMTHVSSPVVTRAPERSATEIEPQRSMSKIWIYAVLSLIVVLVVIWAVRPKRGGAPVEIAAAPAPPKAATRAPDKAWETRILVPEGNSTKPLARAAHRDPVPTTELKTAKREPPTVNGPVWRVVVFTYGRADAAENKARSVKQQHPDLDPEVFSPKGHATLFLVTIGGRMTREDAARLRHKALSLGLPRDSYIQNYRQ